MNYLPTIIIIGILAAIALPAYNDYAARARAMSQRVSICEVQAETRAKQPPGEITPRKEPRRNPVLCGGVPFQVASVALKAVKPFLPAPAAEPRTVLVAEAPIAKPKSAKTAEARVYRSPLGPSS